MESKGGRGWAHQSLVDLSAIDVLIRSSRFSGVGAEGGALNDGEEGEVMNVDNASPKLCSVGKEREGCCLRETQRSGRVFFSPHKHPVMREHFSLDKGSAWKVKENTRPKNNDDFPLKLVQ